MKLIRWAFVYVAVVTLSPLGSIAFAQTSGTREARFEATAAIAREGADASVAIDILRWSTDEEIEDLMAILEEGSDGLAQHLEDASTLGYLWTAESVGYSIRYAARAEIEGVGSRIILALNARFGSRNPTLWESELVGDAPYTLVEVRMNAGGDGEGRNVLPTATAYAFGIDGYELSQVLLRNVTLAD